MSEIKKGSRVYVDFISESRTQFSGNKFTGRGTVDLSEDGYVFGRLDDGRCFMCGEGDLALVNQSGGWLDHIWISMATITLITSSTWSNWLLHLITRGIS